MSNEYAIMKISAEEKLKKMLAISRKVLGCGDYFNVGDFYLAEAIPFVHYRTYIRILHEFEKMGFFKLEKKSGGY